MFKENIFFRGIGTKLNYSWCDGAPLAHRERGNINFWVEFSATLVAQVIP